MHTYISHIRTIFVVNNNSIINIYEFVNETNIIGWSKYSICQEGIPNKTTIANNDLKIKNHQSERLDMNKKKLKYRTKKYITTHFIYMLWMVCNFSQFYNRHHTHWVLIKKGFVFFSQPKIFNMTKEKKAKSKNYL